MGKNIMPREMQELNVKHKKSAKMHEKVLLGTVLAEQDIPNAKMGIQYG